MTKACRTFSTAAMQVIAGCMPVELEIAQKALVTKIRRREYVTWNTYLFDLGDDLSEEYQKKEKEKLKTKLHEQWQKDWDENNHGRITYKFIKDVNFNHDHQWFLPSKSCVDIITGYGSINKSLFERNCIQSPKCPNCTEEDESVEHLLFGCPLYDDIRTQDIMTQESRVNWHKLLKDEEKYKSFHKYVTQLIKKRKEFIQQNN